MIIDRTGKITNINDLENAINNIEKKIKEIEFEFNLYESKLNELYNDLNQDHILKKGTISKSKKKLSGPLINFLKKLFNKLLYPPLANLFETQTKFNSNTTKLLNLLREKLNQILLDMKNNFSNNLNIIDDKVEQLNKKLLELNHYRYIEIKNLEHTLNNELINLKAELGNISYTYLFLQKNMQDVIEKNEVIKKEIYEKNEAIKKEIIKLDSKIEKTKIQLIAFSHLKEKITEESYKKDLSYEKISNQNILKNTLYFNLEDKLRGSEEEIANRQYIYLEHLKNCQPVLDIGCGRGEMLEHLKNYGIEAIGIDSNHIMVEFCLSKKLNAIKGDALTYLSNIEDNSLGAIFASHFIEHLYPADLLNFLSLSYNKLKPNGLLIMETPNVLGLYSLSQSFYLDITHINPVHPHTLKLLLELLNFNIKKILFLSPWEDNIQLASLPDKIYQGEHAEIYRLIQENFTKLNEILFAPRDYAIIAEK